MCHICPLYFYKLVLKVQELSILEVTKHFSVKKEIFMSVLRQDIKGPLFGSLLSTYGPIQILCQYPLLFRFHTISIDSFLNDMR